MGSFNCVHFLVVVVRRAVGTVVHGMVHGWKRTRRFSLCNGLMEGGERLQWSAGNTPLLFFSPPGASFLHPRRTRWLSHTPPPLPFLPLPSPLCQQPSIYGEMHSIHFQSPGFSSGAALVLLAAVFSTTSLTPCAELPAFLLYISPLSNDKLKFINL